MKVSKELLLGAGIKKVVSFRSGGLLYNPKLPQAMEALGYKYSSCFSAEDVLSYFPYRYVRNYSNLTNESKIWEFPLVLEDEESMLYFRVDDALNLFKKIYDNGAVYTILIHPDLTIYKGKNLDLLFLEKFINELPKDVWIDSMEHVGDFWDKRDRVVFRYIVYPDKIFLELYSPVKIDNLAFDLHNIKLKNKNDRLVLNINKGYNKWILER